MLEPKDLQQIGEEVGKVIEQNVTPPLDELRHDLGTVKEEISIIHAEMVTKSYLDDKLADVEGTMVGRLRKEDAKVNRLVEILKTKNVLTEQDAQQLAEFQIFPRTS